MSSLGIRLRGSTPRARGLASRCAPPPLRTCRTSPASTRPTHGRWERYISALEVPRVLHSGHAIEVVDEVVIKFTVGVVPELIVRSGDHFLEVEDLERLFHVRGEDAQRVAEEL